jgi:hypothetical protein
MREILPGRLWLGNAGDGCNPELLLTAGIAAVVNLAMEEPSPTLPRTIAYCHFPIVDGEQETPNMLCVAIRTLVSLLENRIPTLVYCGAGMSRSPAIAAAAIAIVEGESPEDRLRQIVSGGPHDVSPQLWAAVRAALRNIYLQKSAWSGDNVESCEENIRRVCSVLESVAEQYSPNSDEETAIRDAASAFIAVSLHDNLKWAYRKLLTASNGSLRPEVESDLRRHGIEPNDLA